MPEPKTPELNDQFSFAVFAYGNAYGDAFWLGLHYDPNIGDFFWISENLKMTNPNWGSGQPMLQNGNCVVVSVGSAVWKSEDCNKLHGVICQTGENIILLVKQL